MIFAELFSDKSHLFFRCLFASSSFITLFHDDLTFDCSRVSEVRTYQAGTFKKDHYNCGSTKRCVKPLHAHILVAVCKAPSKQVFIRLATEMRCEIVLSPLNEVSKGQSILSHWVWILLFICPSKTILCLLAHVFLLSYAFN